MIRLYVNVGFGTRREGSGEETVNEEEAPSVEEPGAEPREELMVPEDSFVL